MLMGYSDSIVPTTSERPTPPTGREPSAPSVRTVIDTGKTRRPERALPPPAPVYHFEELD